MKAGTSKKSSPAAGCTSPTRGRPYALTRRRYRAGSPCAAGRHVRGAGPGDHGGDGAGRVRDPTRRKWHRALAEPSHREATGDARPDRDAGPPRRAPVPHRCRCRRALREHLGSRRTREPWPGEGPADSQSWHRATLYTQKRHLVAVCARQTPSDSVHKPPQVDTAESGQCR
jgi:hypothetical protein